MPTPYAPQWKIELLDHDFDLKPSLFVTSVNIFMLSTPISTFLLLVQVDPSEKLDPEVEDILMDIADEFVESVSNQTEIYYISSMFQTIGFLLLKNCPIGVIIIFFFFSSSSSSF